MTAVVIPFKPRPKPDDRPAPAGWDALENRT